MPTFCQRINSAGTANEAADYEKGKGRREWEEKIKGEVGDAREKQGWKSEAWW